jgi:hypothetical protein
MSTAFPVRYNLDIPVEDRPVASELHPQPATMDDRGPPPPYSSVNPELESLTHLVTPPVIGNAPIEDIPSPGIPERSEAAVVFDETNYIVQQQHVGANEEDEQHLSNLQILEQNGTDIVLGQTLPQRHLQSVSPQNTETERLGEQVAVEFEAQRDDGGVRVSHVYIRNHDGDSGPRIEARNGLRPRGRQDKTIELEEGHSELIRVETSRPSRTPISSLLACLRPKPPTPPTPKKTLSLRLKHLLGLNPGFCPGALRLRRLPFHRLPSDGKCTYCGLVIDNKYPRSYTTGYTNYPKFSREFIFESHVCCKTRDVTEWRGCLICWEYEGRWISLGKEEWGKHVRRHFEKEGYWICKGEGGEMNRTWGCKAVRCKGVHC